MSTIDLGEGREIACAVEDHTDPWRPHDTVVFLPGFARCGAFWDAWVPHLSRHVAVVRPDLPGCGDSPLPPDGFRYATAPLVDVVLDLLDALDLGRAHLVGESSGGILAANVAAAHPDRVASATLISTPLRPATYDASVKHGGHATAEAAMRAEGMAGWWLASRRLGGELSGDDARDAWFAGLLARTSVEVGVAFWEWIHDPSVDLTPVLPVVTCPTLLMTPGRSHATAAAQQEEMAAMLPDGHQRRYPDLNHEMYYLAPDRLAADLRDFLLGPGGVA